MRNAPRKHVCFICSNTYAKAEHLIRHERTHTGDRPFTCLWCKRKFSRQDSLARHQQRQGHDGVPPGMSVDSQGDITAGANDPSQTIRNTAGLDQYHPQATVDSGSQALLESHHGPATQLQSFDNTLGNDAADEFLLPLTWPDSEELLQSILTSNLAPWSDNVELLPSQYLLNTAVQVPHDVDSPWLTQDPAHQAESGSHAIRNVSQIISELSANVTSEAESAALSTVFLDACLHMFFDQFTSNFAVCHRPTFIFRDWTHPLLLNSIALGSLFVGHEVNAAKGEVLWKLAHTAVATSWHSLILHQGPSDPCPGIQLILTALLGQTYAMLSGTARLRSTAQIFHSLGFYWARQCDMYNYKRKFNPTDVMNAETRDQKMELWKLWAAEEVQLRALLGHYILDGQLPYLTGAPTCQRHASNPLRLPCSDTLFQASTLEIWMEQLSHQEQQTTTFRQLFFSLFANAATFMQSYPKLTPLTLEIIVEGLESFVSEANTVDGSVVGNPSNQDISQALGSLHQYIQNSTHLSLGDKTNLIVRWHIVCIDAATNFNNLCRNMCSQHSVDQSVFGPAKLDASSVDLRRWIDTSQARRALLHAVAVWDAIACLPSGQAHAINMPICVFAAATIYCASVLGGSTAITIPYSIDWVQLMSTDSADNVNGVQENETELMRYISNQPIFSSGRTINLLYDCNVFLMRLRQIRRPWGICTAFESIVQQWLSKCGI